MKKPLIPFALLPVLLAVAISSCTVPGSSTGAQNRPIKGVTAITEVFGDGQKVIAVAVEYDKTIDTARLAKSDFSVGGRTITNVYANTTPATASQGVNGKYAIIELSPNDAGASTISQGMGGGNTPAATPGQGIGENTPTATPGQGTSGTPQGGSASIKEVKVSVTQVGDVTTTDGVTYAPDPTAITNDKVINPIVDDFKQLEYKDPKTGITLKYNLFIPKNYDKNKSYPLVMFIHDAGAVSNDTRMTLVQGLGAVIWASPSDQAKHPGFVLAPQFSTVIANDNSETTPDLDVAADLIKSLESQYSIDKNRIYTTGQSMGGMSSIALLIKYPDMFAAAMLVACQWDAQKMSVLAKDKLWIMVSEGDVKAFPGMNASLAMMEADGAKVDRATWDGNATAAEQATNVQKMIAEGGNIQYTALKKGTVVTDGQPDSAGNNHRYTWQIAYTIEGIRDWLFAQTKG
ncbi:MAG TPA: alpha/beta hydrolase-fold protein [Ktedonosporobacter sp.]|nr:alpha/beta hydrolase-fold protein [Ktedonosporobacter sp.]